MPSQVEVANAYLTSREAAAVLVVVAEASLDEELRDLARDHETTISCIGHIQAAKDVRLTNQPWPRPLFTHFRPGDLS